MKFVLSIITSIVAAGLTAMGCGSSRPNPLGEGGNGTTATGTGNNGTAGGTTGAGGATGTTGTGGAATGTGGTTTGTTTTTACTAACCSPATCKVADLECIGLVDNAGSTKPGLRMGQLDISAPSALASGILGSILASAVTPSDAKCNLTGTGTTSWLLQFDLGTDKLRTGVAGAVTNPASGYGFLTQTLGSFAVAPVDVGAAVASDGSFSTPTGADLAVPIFLDGSGQGYVLLPFRKLRIAGKLSPSHDCIGHYNAEGLDIGNGCLPDNTNHSFVSGGTLNGIITLEDADKSVIPQLQQTLCVLLAGNMGVTGPNGYKVCQRNASNKIVFQGNACSTGAGCSDAVTFVADFAASSVKIN